jgi:hypothetical protein
MKSEKTENEKEFEQHLYKYYDVLHWGEELNLFLSENQKFYHDYNGKFLQFTYNNQIVGGLVLYFNQNFNAHVIGCSAIDPTFRGKGHFKTILTTFNYIYPRLYLFCKPDLVTLYSRFFNYQKKILNMNIYLFSNYETTLEDKGPFF